MIKEERPLLIGEGGRKKQEKKKKKVLQRSRKFRYADAESLIMTGKSIVIRKAHSHDVSVLSGLIRDSFCDVAERFGITPENCPKHPSNLSLIHISEPPRPY